MLAALGFDLDTDAFDVSFGAPPLNQSSGRPRLYGMGDPVAGPLLGLFYDAPSTAEELAGPPDLTPAHSHSCDSFRIVMKGELWVGQERYHHGEFRLQQSGIPYGQDGDAPHAQGNWRIIFFADRRGFAVRPTNPEARAQMRVAVEAMRDRYRDVLPEILDADDGGVVGLVTTITTPVSTRGHIDGTFADVGAWQTLGESQAAVSLLGLPDRGPVVVLAHTPAAATAAPECTFDTDGFRLVVGGSYERAGTTYAMGDMRFQGAGTQWDRVVAGPDGLDEVIILGDRRGAVPHVDDGDGAARAWRDELDATLARLRADLAASA
ncbi:MAG TPA: hypothetical protein VH986_12265 [Acidimicrobiia bacterium]|jgi:hypothetical protein